MLSTRTPYRHRLAPVALSVALALVGPTPAFAAETEDRDAILRQIELLREQQAAITRMQRENEASLSALESRLSARPTTESSSSDTRAQPSPVASRATTTDQATMDGRLQITGDFRVRSQSDNSDRDGVDRTSGQVRGRLDTTFAVNERVTIGARLATGDSDDPNSTDVQLSNWLDDLRVSLDQAYVQVGFGDLTLCGGKFPQPFVRTELVWDGDVNPQGLAAAYRHTLADVGTLRATGTFLVLDEQAAGADSMMVGAQIGYDTRALGAWKLGASVAWYDYKLGSIAGADAGDWRSNLLNPDGSYVSDYELADAILEASYLGLGELWPLRIVGDYVRNTASRVDGDTGYSMDLIAGRASRTGDWRVTYGYARADVDAVLAAFSRDNIALGTNYRMHAVGFDYVPWPKTTVSAILYRYRPESEEYAGSSDPNDWLNRIRISLMIGF